MRKHAKNLQEGEAEEDYVATFVLARDPISAQVCLYNVPNDAFDREEEAVPEAEDETWEADEAAPGGA